MVTISADCLPRPRRPLRASPAGCACSGGVRLGGLCRSAARAVYRHFPDKLSLLARVAEHGWQQLGLQATKSTVGKPAGEEALIGASLSLLHFAQEHPNLFHLMAGERFNMEGKFPRLEATTHKALQVFAVGFAGTGMAPDIVVERTAIFVAALQGVVTQILHRRLRVAPVQTNAFLAARC